MRTSEGEIIKVFNPFDLQRVSTEDIATEVKRLMGKIDNEADTVGGLSDNIDYYTDILYLYGELVARVQGEYSHLKLDNNNEETKMAYDLKKDWLNKNGGKAPTMSYFNANAAYLMKEKRSREMDLNSQLSRLKYAYESTQERINSIKKKMDAIKFEQS